MISRIVLALFAAMFLAGPLHAQDVLPDQTGPRAAPTTRVEVHQLPVMDATPSFDAAKATDKYLARIAGAARAKSDHYFEGGYGLQLADLVYGLGIAGLLLGLGLSAR